MAKRLHDSFRKLLEDVRVSAAPAIERIDLTGPFLVVGSAPGCRLPEGFDRKSWRVGTINGSQGIAREWGIEEPDVTAMMYGHLDGQSPNSPAVRALVAGHRTGHLMIMGLDAPAPSAAEQLRGMDYGYGSMQHVTRLQRSKFRRRFMRTRYYDRVKSERVSNGIFLVEYALACGAAPVVITGIAPNTTGHAYNELGLPRRHADADAKALQHMVGRGDPVFTADPGVAEAFAIPLWPPAARPSAGT